MLQIVALLLKTICNSFALPPLLEASFNEILEIGDVIVQALAASALPAIAPMLNIRTPASFRVIAPSKKM
jgi:hypothetical protein